MTGAPGDTTEAGLRAERKPLNVGKETVKGTLWIYVSNYSGQFLVFLSTIVLARLLTQDDYGVVGYALVTTSLLNVLNDLGIGPALIYHRDEPDAPHTAFWLSLLFGVIMFGITYLIAPLVALFFQDDRAIPVLRVMALVFPLAALENVHDNLLRKNLDFKKKFVPEFARASSKGLSSIGMALAGFGAWSLVYGQLIGKLFSIVSYWKVAGWRPAFRLNRRIAQSLIRYGLYIVGLNALAILLANIDYLLVGRYMGAAALGVYTLAFRIPDLLVTDFCSSLGTVLFPLYVKIRDDGEALVQAVLSTLKYVSVITMPMGVGMLLISRAFVLTFLTDKWIEAIPVMQAISVFTLLMSFSYNTGSFYKALGKVSVMTQLTIVRLVITIPLVVYAALVIKTVAAVGWAQAIVALFSGALNLYVVARMTKTPFRAILESLKPGMIASAAMAAVVLPVNFATNSAHPAVQLVLAILLGGSVYLGVLYLMQRDLFLAARRTLATALGGR